MRVSILAKTDIHPFVMSNASKGEWEVQGFDVPPGSTLAEFAGRQCYQSWSRPNPKTATVEGYIENIIDQGHFSVLEHGSVTFHISDVSRSLTHELVRHRHLSFSQLSQRFVKVDFDGYTTPPLYEHDVEAQKVLEQQWRSAVEAYDQLVARWLPKLLQDGWDQHTARKKAREAARSVLPGMAATSIVVTGNHRTWREFIEKRGSKFADAEIRQLAIEIFSLLSMIEHPIYQDFALDNDEKTGEAIVVRHVRS